MELFHKFVFMWYILNMMWILIVLTWVFIVTIQDWFCTLYVFNYSMMDFVGSLCLPSPSISSRASICFPTSNILLSYFSFKVKFLLSYIIYQFDYIAYINWSLKTNSWLSLNWFLLINKVSVPINRPLCSAIINCTVQKEDLSFPKNGFLIFEN